MVEPHLLSLEALCRAKGVKLLAVRAYGLMGYMRVSDNTLYSKPVQQRAAM